MAFLFVVLTYLLNYLLTVTQTPICTVKPRTRTLTRDIDIAILSVCPSVCLSVRDTMVLYENGLTYRHIFSPYGSPIIPGFTSIKHLHEIPMRSPPAGALNRGGVY